jgi:NADH dehydrogenase
VDPFNGRVRAWPLDFDDPSVLRAALSGVDVVFNTYWVRFEHGATTFDDAVRNSRALIDAAAAAGVRRFVHCSVTNPDPDSPLLYFRGKAMVERALRESGLSHAILRPALFFGGDDVLINNIAWLLRRLPVFGVANNGAYHVQPIHVRDFASLAVDLARAADDAVVDAVGPEIWAFEELVHAIAKAVGSRSRILHLSPKTVWLAAAVLGRLLNDVLLTRDEIDGLTAGLLVSRGASTGTTRFSDWLVERGAELGTSYASELARHYRPTTGTVARQLPPCRPVPAALWHGMTPPQRANGERPSESARSARSA